MAHPRRRVEVSLPELVAFDGAGLQTDQDYDALAFHDLDLHGQDAGNSRFLECGFFGCRLDETAWRRARFSDCVLADVGGVGVDWSGSSWLDVELISPRLAAVQAYGAELTRVVVRGGKVDYINFRGATLTDVHFEGCLLREADFTEARLTDVTFERCEVVEADVSRARLERVDLSGADLSALKGVTSLAGARISSSQLLQLAPAFATQLGIAVVDDI
jgi:uncharacterized protein YjbI with pentapeptide repeats